MTLRYDEDDLPGNGLWSRPPVTLPYVTMQHNGEGAPPSGHVRYAPLPVPLLAPLSMRNSGRDRLREYRAKWRAANRERIRESDRRYREKNPERVRALAAARQRRYEERKREHAAVG